MIENLLKECVWGLSKCAILLIFIIFLYLFYGEQKILKDVIGFSIVFEIKGIDFAELTRNGYPTGKQFQIKTFYIF